ncbi:thiamine pyrophosphokinase [Ktedonobacter sp. SOSP1-52]|uniref:thiamine diphosphokinase n=1 Tax=Ktedonobacter sp. SOSP1-52 TaxID=2778366 RepID=UPI00191682FB|nr:thiamine diphosphokinase [Ktedonobacter sp. SOSP1-52]GHO66187.1 thiamine pyrophosphokinase [Ktedonobacter sp. SOSP1-52]
MHIVVFAAGSLRPGSGIQEALASADLVIAADKGAQTALDYGLTPRVIVGDFDSLTLPEPELRARGCELVRVAEEKDETDTELALQLALEHGATRITLLGGWGGERMEHALGNIMLLASITSVPVCLVDGPSVCWVVHGPARTQVHGTSNDLLSLFPLVGDVTGLTTTNLQYALRDGCLRFGSPRGISNVLTHDLAEVEVGSGVLLLVHTRRSELQE